jgi:HD-GYP domain-containing protein (c-di-GMP phosphodiesterase class II)
MPSAISALSIINRRNKNNTPKPPYDAEISVKMNNDEIVVDYDNAKDEDFIKAAYGIIKACQQKGLTKYLVAVLQTENINLNITESEDEDMETIVHEHYEQYKNLLLQMDAETQLARYAETNDMPEIELSDNQIQRLVKMFDDAYDANVCDNDRWEHVIREYLEEINA